MRLPDGPRGGEIGAAEAVLPPSDNSDGGDIHGHPPHRGSDWYRELSRRLARLPEAHPSAWPVSRQADWADGRDRDSEIWWRRDAEDSRAGESADGHGLGSDEYSEAGLGADGQLGSGEDGGLAAGPDSEADESDSPSPEAGSASRLSGPEGPRRAPAAWSELGGPAPGRSPYRPWFSADGTGDPWFAPEWGE